MLEIHEYHTGYNKVEIIRNVSLRVDKGKIVSIIGRNGVGKSTLMKGIMGLLTTKNGKVLLDNKDITLLNTHERARIGIGYVPQGHGVFPNLTVEENIKMGESINKKAKKMDYEIIFNYFPRIKERLSQKAGTLSGGERAQLSIGRALIGNPDLLLLDEPSEGIQPNIIQSIGDIINQINKDLGLTVLLVEQHIGLIKSLADTCYAMDKGSIVGKHEASELTPELIQKYLSV
ncbi:ABC transporter ATP-binding protein [Fredinandcohnia salidurans]|uniref:ABC transporter ATP-binding protein n=1 Tax=Fredinandcohnia salidurans TaxID=2595041 RepID=A0ABW4MUD1_9BACI